MGQSLILLRETPAGLCAKNKKYEALFSAPTRFEHPYDPQAVTCAVSWRSPGGRALETDAFWYEGFDRVLENGREVLLPSSVKGWMLRFTPRQTGRYEYTIRLKDVKSGAVWQWPQTGTHAFIAADSLNKGFLRVSERDPAYLCFDDQSPYLGIGHNLCGWEWGGTDNLAGTYDYDRWLTRLHDAQGNMAQFDFGEGDQLEWTPHEDELPFSPEWRGLGEYNQQTAWKMDYRIARAEELGVYFRLSLFHWEDFDHEAENFPDWGWNRNPYNVENGGPNEDVSDFFKNPLSRGFVARYLRYVAARWGYSPNLLAYELWNEADAPDMVWGGRKTFSTAWADLFSWHREMAARLRSFDVNGHLITTSFADTRNGIELFKQKEMDLTTFHRYTYFNPDYQDKQFDTVRTLDKLISRQFAQTGKPVLAGEFALSPGGDIQKDRDPAGFAFHRQLWSSVMAKSLGTAMHWTWGSYIDAYGLYKEYTPLAKFFADANLTGLRPENTLKSRKAVQYMALRGESSAYLWLFDARFDFAQASAGKKPKPRGGTAISLPFAEGRYAAAWVDTSTGDTLLWQEISTADGQLRLTIPPFKKDIAVKITRTERAPRFTSADIPSARPSSFTAQWGRRLRMSAGGCGFLAPHDDFRFAYIKVKGDFTLTARLMSFTYSGETIKAGLMVRTGLDLGARYAALYLTPSFAAGFGAKEADGLISLERLQRFNTGSLLKLVRRGDVISGYARANAEPWRLIGQRQFRGMENMLMVGLAAGSHNAITYCTAEFSEIEMI